METAPEKLKNPIFKTTKILVAYAVDIVIKIPKEEVDSVNDHGAGCYILPEIGNSWPAMFDQDGELHARLDPDNSRPTLLGVLAREINSI